MDIIKWRDSYETGIKSMDTQHHNIIELINKLYKVIRNSESAEVIEEVFSEMAQYAEKHLKEEEALLKKNGYQGFDEHLALHQAYQEKLNNLMTNSKQEKDATVQDTYIFLRQWWVEHIMAEDHKYGEFLESKGVD